MPRIHNHSGSVGSYQPDADEPDFDTASRVREPKLRSSMHESRDSVTDARNTPRKSSEEYTYRPPTSLDAPEPRPGYVQRWIRVAERQGADTINLQNKEREGWTPRDPSTISHHDDFFSTSVATSNTGGVFRVGNLVLHEMPEARLMAKRRYLAEQNRKQWASVATETEKISREGAQRGYAPIVREETAEFTTGRRPKTMAD